MRETTDELPPRMWTALLASLPACFGCSASLRNTVSCNDGFCRDCLERSRAASTDEELGGES